MKKEIKIKSARLSLIVESVEGPSIPLRNKAEMQFQSMYQITSSGDWISTSTSKLLKVPRAKGVTKIIWLSKKPTVTDQEFFGESGIYSLRDLETILRFLSSITPGYTKVAEALVLSTGSASLLSAFKKSYGTIGCYNFKTFLKAALSDPSSLDVSESPEYRYSPSWKKYSLLNFLRDIKSSGSQLYLNDSVYTVPKITEPDPDTVAMESRDKMYDIEDIHFGGTKPNINIVYRLPMKVRIPKNEYILDQTLPVSRLSSVSILRNGDWNTRLLGFKILDSMISGKLKRLGVIVKELSSNVFIIDLSKMPIYSRSAITAVDGRSMAKWEVDIIRVKGQLSLLKRYAADNKIQLQTEYQDFLQSLGINKGIYSDLTPRSKVVFDDYLEMIPKVEGIKPLTQTQLDSYIKTGSTQSPKSPFWDRVLSETLAKYVNLEPEQLLQEKENLEGRLKMIQRASREKKFSLFVTKTCTFSDTRKSPDVPMLIDVPELNQKVSIVWQWKDASKSKKEVKIGKRI